MNQNPAWGRLANQNFANQRIKTTLFFSGQARDGSIRYECPPRNELNLYTVHPIDGRHLNWSTSSDNRAFALDEMLNTGINVVSMSSWGEAFLPCTTGWNWAPMQTSPLSHDELFSAAVGKPILITPFIERRGDWTFYNEFPTFNGQIAPGTVSQINELINRYLKNPSHPEWADKWTRVYDRNGEERYAIVIIQASSNRIAVNDHDGYAAGFDNLAEQVFNATRVKVGFFLDALPPGGSAPGLFKPTPEETGSHLRNRASILGIQCFIPEVWLPRETNDVLRLSWKRDFSRRWSETGIPFIMDVAPGYDGHIVFPGSAQFGLDQQWIDSLTSMVNDFGEDGLVYNSWNGYTEGMAAVPTQEFGYLYYQWLQSLNPDLLTAEGKVTLLRVHDEGTGYGPPRDFIDVEVVISLDSQPGKAFGFQLRDDANEGAHRGMLQLLCRAFNHDARVRIDYLRNGLQNGRIIRVMDVR
jgi:hypothetical protein